MLGTIDLDQLAQALAPEPWLVERSPLFARQPQAIGDHPLANRLSSYPDPVPLEQRSSCQCRSEVAIALPDQLKRVLPHAGIHLVIGTSPARLMDHRSAATLAIPR